jgi:hypothetical protein
VNNLKKIISILIISVLVLAAFTMIAGNVKAQSGEVSVLTYSQYIAPASSTLAVSPGDLIVVGELRNIGSNIIGNVTVQGTALGANGQTLAVTSSQAFVYYMKSGQKAPFYLDFTAGSSQTQDLSWVPSVSHVLVSVISVQNVNQRQYEGAKVTYDMNYTDHAGLYVVRGTVVNEGGLIAQQPWVVTTFYDASGTVVGLNFTNFLTSTLSTNGGVLFFAVPADNNTDVTSKIKNYSFQVDSLTFDNSLITSSPTSTASDSGSSADQIPILPIAIVLVLVVIALAALMLFRSRKKMPLPPPPPTE